MIRTEARLLEIAGFSADVKLESPHKEFLPEPLFRQLSEIAPVVRIFEEMRKGTKRLPEK